ncbi:hypothetical protein K493DRAFT_305663 [Basidiobolus meristosporus CBS 931.73]|uniref:L-serine ammonia-lyase n=1 Tax=Basidiobolus meristosporus CBS 931.73 TaxID=1314790 RepID=A0A1Y1XV20_9FUNG|nr:hypothetical protein K493DRAFT_305663 [Basidiobolus meristosporus CBS 931.73]|eukprot:ORX89563.1 hypothetical protein K493DRAFT_305663 [Basidiobolus meristosporus CBS 931.73]
MPISLGNRHPEQLYQTGSNHLLGGRGQSLGGALLGFKSLGRANVPVSAAETVGAACFHASTLAYRHTVLDEVSTRAGTLGCQYVAQGVWELAVAHSGKVTSYFVTYAKALNACKWFLNDHNILVEPSCGALLAIVYRREAKLLEVKGPVTVIAHGDKWVSLQLLDKWSQLLGV